MRKSKTTPGAVASQESHCALSTRKAGLGVGILWAAMAAVGVLGTGIAAPTVEARGVTYNLDIPAQKLDDALRALALASQHKLLYSSRLVAGRYSPELKGEYTA